MALKKDDDPWASISPDASQLLGRRVEGAHALAIYWVRNSDGLPGLLLRGIDRSALPRALPRPRGMAIVVSPQGKEPVEVGLYLQAVRDQQVFLALCLDVIAYSSDEITARTATIRAFRRLEHWHSLLARGALEEMGAQEIRGFIGELWVLLQLAGRVGMEAALLSWVAPDDHPQDFAADSGIVEVKTRLSGSKPHVRISSLEQLEDGPRPLHLMVVEVAPSSETAGRSLSQFAQEVMDQAEAEGLSTADRAALALLHRGYTRKDAYGVDYYTIPGARAFRVAEDFPRFTRSEADQRIHAATYILDLTALAPFECPLDNAWPEEGKQPDHG